MYVLWSVNLGGWVSKTGNYTTELHEARRFDEDDTIRRVKLGFQTHDNTFGVLPIPAALLEDVIHD